MSKAVLNSIRFLDGFFYGLYSVEFMCIRNIKPIEILLFVTNVILIKICAVWPNFIDNYIMNNKEYLII